MMLTRLQRFGQRWQRLACALLFLFAYGTQLSQAAPVTLNLKDADINALVASISEITGKNFIVDPRVKGKVSVISSRPMDESEIYQVFLSILAVHGFAAVPSDRVIKIVPSAGAKQEQIPTLNGHPIGGDDQMVTQVVQVRNISAAQIIPLLRPLIPPQGHLAAYGPSNVLIISDLAGNVKRMASIIQRIDQASDEDVEIIALHNAAATEVVQVLQNLEQGRAQQDPAAATSAPQLVADERTNSILLSGDKAGRLRTRTLIAHLDTPLESNGNTQVVYLRYAKAEELLPVLLGVSNKLDQKNELQNKTPDSAPKQANKIDIQADPATNALVITGDPDDIQALKSVVAQLDIRRAQVLVEAAIAEVSTDRVAELGIQWLIDGNQNGSAVGFTNFDNASFNGISLGDIASSIINDTLPLSVPIGGALALGDFSSDSRVKFGALISALAGDTDTNVLSTPTIVTLDNEEAEIIVGQNVPFVTGTFTTDTNGGNTVGNPFQTIERQDVGLTLRVTPQINEGNAVQLQIVQEVSQVVPSATAASQGPTTNKRSIRTNVLVEDGQVLILGGLIDDNLSEIEQKVPGLGDIPVLGNLFRYRQTVKGKRNLMIFLHPVILRTSTQGSQRSNAKYSYIREQQTAARERGTGLLPNVETPLLADPQTVREQGSFVEQILRQPEIPPAVNEHSKASTTQPDNNLDYSGYSRK